MEKGYWIKSGKNGNCPEEEIDSLKKRFFKSLGGYNMVMFVLRMDALILTSKEALPKTRMCITQKSIWSHNYCQYSSGCLRECLLFWNRGQWRIKCRHYLMPVLSTKNRV